jgi:hypothetical protein
MIDRLEALFQPLARKKLGGRDQATKPGYQPIVPVRANRELFAVARHSVLQHCVRFRQCDFEILLTLVFICLMLFVLKRQANRVINAYLKAETQRPGLIAIILIFGLASALLKCRNPRIPDRAGRDRSADRPEPAHLQSSQKP